MKRVLKSCIALLLSWAMLISVAPQHVLAIAEGVESNTESTGAGQPTEEGYIRGRLKLVKDGQEISELLLADGEKDYLYTKLIGLSDSDLSYTWQILINEEGNRWATINDYVLNYAVISEALIKNHPNENGHATVRCIADDGEQKYVSESVEIIPRSAMLFSAAPFTYSNAEEEADIVNADPDSPDTFQIVINYVFRHKDNAEIDGTAAASLFTVTLPDSASYTGTIASPPVIGYTPYIPDPNGSFEYGGQTYTYAAYHSFEQQHENVTVVIHYIPNVVNYVVKSYEQNLYNDEYTYAGSVVKTGYADTFVADGLDVPRNGFEALPYDKNVLITGDGQAAVSIYYDRIYCLVDVELGDGAHGVVPYYVRYDTQIILGTPVRPGYHFLGWELTKLNKKPYGELNDDEKVAWETYTAGSVAGTMLTLNHAVATQLCYTAQWEKAQTTYSAIYWVENAEDDGFTLWGYKVYDAVPGQIVSAQDDMEREDKACFTFNESRSDKNVVVKGDGTTAVNVYYNRNYYSLIFKDAQSDDCYAPVHTHDGISCERPLICGNETTHVHDESCGAPTQICEYEEHTHTEECHNSCTIAPHPEHTDSCLICTVEPHTHTWQCYNGATSTKPSAYVSVSGQQQDGFIGRSYSWFTQTKWIYVGGSWYQYTGDVAYGSQAQPNSRLCPGVHVHSEENGCYSDRIHIHNDWCCNIPEHTHDVNACYTYPCGQKQHSHENCYGDCILYEHTHTNEGSNKIVKVVTKKYNAALADVWPVTGDNGTEYNKGQRWEPQDSSLYSNVLVYIPFMPSETTVFVINSANYDPYNMTYYLESLPGMTGDVLYKEVQYDRNNEVSASYNYLTRAEDFFDIVGFTQYEAGPQDFGSNGQLDINGNDKTVNLYYTRNSYHIVYNNNGIVRDVEEPVKYQAPLTNYNIEPEYPANMEAGACEFAGWYYTPTCADGTEVDFNTATMPAGDLILYAKWIPKQYRVEVYMDDSFQVSILDGMYYFNDMVEEPQLDDYNQPSDPDMPAVIPDTYRFAGWYYMDGSVEKRFDFNTMMVKQSYRIYAKWTSMVMVDYKIYYKVRHANGELEDIAIPTEEQALVGITKSFTAKMGDELEPAFRLGYYPEERSVSIEMNADESKNVFTFIYEHQERVEYSLIHTFTDSSTEEDSLVNLIGKQSFQMKFDYVIENASDTPAEIILSFRQEITEANIRAAIQAANPNVTLTQDQLDAAWNMVTNLSPDAYEKKLLLVTNHTDGQNTVTFNWAAGAGNCVYQVVHYLQDVDANEGASTADNYTLSPTHVQAPFVVPYTEGKKVTIDYLDIEGFHLNQELSGCKTDENGSYVMNGDRYVCEGTLTRPTVGDLSGGLIFRIYYDRNEYTYYVKHVVEDKEYVVKKGPVRYEAVVTETAKDIDDPEAQERLQKYYVKGNLQQSVQIREANQEIYFYYQLHMVNYYYGIVGSGNVLKGTLSNYGEEVDVNATPKGSEATAAPGYVFAGWFTDSEGTVPVTDDIAHVGMLHNTVIPIPSSDYVGKPQYFYAKFLPTHIQIRNNNVKDEAHTFVYRLKGVEGTATASIDLNFALVGNGSITVSNLPIGDYVLIPNNDWAYRYETAEIRFTFDDNKTVWVTYDTESEQWLADYSYSDVQ